MWWIFFDPAKPLRVGRYLSYKRIDGLLLSGNYAYISEYNNWLEILDISDPLNPKLASSLKTYTAYDLRIEGKLSLLSPSYRHRNNRHIRSILAGNKRFRFC